MKYIRRLIEDDMLEKLASSGALLIKGPKSCGKTETAKQYAKSILQIDRYPQVPVIMATNPQLLLEGQTPRLIDEWQEQPQIWNYVRHEVDDRNLKGQFILTVSSNPTDDVKLHSGSGRFTVLQMETMSWQELGYSSGTVKLSDLLAGHLKDFYEPAISLDFIIERMCIGGWPSLIGESTRNALNMNRSYVDLLLKWT